MQPESLLSHADFVRALARRLLTDENAADDAVQAAWLAALEHPPRAAGLAEVTGAGRSARAWLAIVLRRFVYRTHRDEVRRHERERVAARREAVEATSKMLERESIRRQVIDAVVALDEPYRGTVVLRFYDDLPPREIARRLVIPVETVKTRIKRGLARIREDLDGRHGGDRKGWFTALLPVAGWKLGGGAAASGVGSTAAAGSGVVLMSIKIKLVIAAVVLVGIGLPLWQLMPEEEGTPHGELQAAAVTVDDDAIEGAPDGGAASSKGETLARAAESDPDPEPARAEPTRMVLAPEGICLEGTVTEKGTGDPVTDFQVRVEAENPRLFKRLTVSDEGGAFRIPIEEEAVYDIEVRSACYRPLAVKELDFTEGKTVEPIRIELDPGARIRGRVVEDSTGKPVPGAVVGTNKYPTVSVESLIAERIHDGVHAKSDDEGYFVLKGIEPVRQKIGVYHPDYAESSLSVLPGEEDEVEVRMKTGFRIYGKMFADNGEPMTKGTIFTSPKGYIIRPARIQVNPDGSYETGRLAPGEIEIEAHRQFIGDTLCFTGEQKEVWLEDKDLEVNFGEMADFVTWRGRVLDAEGMPLTNGRLLIRPHLNHPRFSRIRPRDLRTDEEGRFEVFKLNPGTFDVERRDGRKPGPSWFFEKKITFNEPGDVERDLHLIGSRCSGHVIDTLTGDPLEGRPGEVHFQSERSVHSHFIGLYDEKGRFSFEGLPADRYTIQAECNGRKGIPVEGYEFSGSGHAEGVVLRMPTGGTLRIRSPKPLSREWSHQDWIFEPKDNQGRIRFFDFGTGHDDFIDETIVLEPGPWLAVLHLRYLGRFEWPVVIKADRTTVLNLDAETLEYYDGTIGLTGRLIRKDGTPVGGVRLVFDPVMVREKKNESRSRPYVRTDDRGAFRLDAVTSGHWRIYAEFLGKGAPKILLKDLIIPPVPQNPYRVELVLGSGSVIGSLKDIRPEHTIPPRNRDLGGSYGEIMLISHENPMFDRMRFTERVVNRIRMNGGGAFALNEIPAGTYRLRVNLRGYAFHDSSPFDLSDGEVLDMKTIELRPVGRLLLKVTDEKEKVLPYQFRIVMNGMNYPNAENAAWAMGEGTVLYDKLPLGDHKVGIISNGYKIKTIEVNLEADKIETRHVMLEAWNK